MGSDSAGIDSGTKTPPRLCYHALPTQRAPEPLGMMTPPLQAPGSVPFRWEEAPGKPLSRISDEHRRPKPAAATWLEPPPGMAVHSSSSSTWQVSKVADGDEVVPSKTVLQGPYYVLLRPSASLFDGPSVMARSNLLSSSSFTIGERSLRCHGVGEGRRERSAVWFWKRAARRGDEESSMGKIEDEPAASYLPRSYSTTAGTCYVDDGEETSVEGSRGIHEGATNPNVRITRFKRSGSLPNLSTATTNLWANIYGGLKQVVMAPWRSSRKSVRKRWSRDTAL